MTMVKPDEDRLRHSANPDNTIHLIHHTYASGGGMERYVSVLGRSLRHVGLRVIVHSHRTDPELATTDDVELDRVKVFRHPRKLQDYRFFRAVDKLRASSRGWQITTTRVRVNDAVICGGTHRSHLKRGRKIAGPFDWLQIWMEREAYRSARIIISHSKLCTSELESLYAIPRKKIVTLYPPVDSRFATPGSNQDRSQFRKQFNLPEDRPVFLFPSTGHRRKGLKPICEAMSELPNPPILAVAGKPPGRFKRSFVVSLGYVKEIEAAYKAADYTILGSIYEPFGLVGVESILSGTPLLFEKDIGCLEAIKPEHVIRFDICNKESIRDAILSAVAKVSGISTPLSSPRNELLYDPSPAHHARELLRILGHDAR